MARRFGLAMAGAAVLLAGPAAAGAASEEAISAKKKPAATCPAGMTPQITKRGRKPALKRDKRGRLRCTAVKRTAVRPPAASPALQVGQVADVLNSVADINPKAFKKLTRAIGKRRTDRLLNAGLVAWRQTAGAAQAHAQASENETKSFGYGGADGNVTFGVERVEGEQSGFKANASAAMKVKRADLEKFSSELKDKLPADVTGAGAKVDVSFEDVAKTCPDDKGAVPGKLHGKGSITVTVERSDGPPIEVTLNAEVTTNYTAQVGADGKVSSINGLDVQTTFQMGGTGTSTATYRGRIAGSGFGREGLFGGPPGSSDGAIQRDVSHLDGNAGGVFGPHGSWRYGGPFPISDLRTIDNVKAMAATSIATQLLTLASLEYLRNVTLDRIENGSCGWFVLVDLATRVESAGYQAFGKLYFSLTARAVPGEPNHWRGSAPAQYTDVTFTSKDECAYHSIVNNPGTFTVDIKLLPNGNPEVTWSADPSATASVDCPPDNSDPPYDPPPVAGMQGPSLVGATPTTFERPPDGVQVIGGGVDAGSGDGIFDSGSLLISAAK